jgi:hypothetical protein
MEIPVIIRNRTDTFLQFKQKNNRFRKKQVKG